MFHFNQIDDDKRLTGAWVEAPGDDEDYEHGKPEFLIAQWMNPNHQKAMMKHVPKQAKKKRGGRNQGIDFDNVDIDVTTESVTKTLADSILLGWRNLYDYQTGEKVEYSKENAELMLSRNYEFREWVSAEAQDEAHYYAERLGKSGKKLKNTPSTSPESQPAEAS